MPFQMEAAQKRVAINHPLCQDLAFRQVSGTEYAEFLGQRDEAGLDGNVWFLSKSLVEADGTSVFSSYEAAKQFFDAAPFSLAPQLAAMFTEAVDTFPDFVDSPLSGQSTRLPSDSGSA